MAFSQPNSRELQHRKILEELHLAKKNLIQQGPAPSLASSIPTVGNTLPTISSTDGSTMNSAQRAALNHANANSTGHFVSQDSAFGNLILPTLPRFDKK